MPCYQIAVLPPDDIVSNALARWGSWECSHGPQCFESRGAAPFPKAGVFLDIGANIGYFSTLFAKAGYRVLAIEPVSRNVHALRNTLCLNRDIQENVTIVHTALGSKSTFGPCVAEAHRTNSGNAVLRCGPNVSCSDLEAPRYHFEDTVRANERRTRVSRSRGYCEDVNISTLDLILQNFLPAVQGQSMLPVVAAKIDAEGAECAILEGGGTLFTVIRPIMIYFESQHAHVLACMRQLADNHGYTLKPGLKWSTPKRMPLNLILVQDDWRLATSWFT